MTTSVLPLISMTASCTPCEERAAAALAANDAKREREYANTEAPVPASQRWSGVLGVEGELTGDGRLIEKGALRWENLPLPLRYVSSDVGAHDGAVVVGRITEVSRSDDGKIVGAGDFDMTSEAGVEAARQVGEGLTNGVSMDLDDVSFELRIAAELMEGGDDDAILIPMMASHASGEEGDDASHVTVMEIHSGDELQVTTSGRLRAATIVAIPAFAEAQIALAESSDTDTVDDAVPDELVAAAALRRPPRSWFENPNLTEPTPLRVGEDGRVYGHLALWGTCHVGFPSECVQPPQNHSGYRYFHTGSVLTDAGEVAVGHITMDTRHAPSERTAASTLAHYEHTGKTVVDVVAGEDGYGIWVAGALRPRVSEEQKRALRASPLSGDWRRVGTDLELIAALAVNVPGFAIPRPQGLVAGGAIQTLVASGMVAPKRVRRPGTEGALSDDDLRYLRRLASLARDMESRSLRDRVNAAKVNAFAAKRLLAAAATTVKI